MSFDPLIKQSEQRLRGILRVSPCENTVPHNAEACTAGGFESGKAAAEEADVHQRVAKKFEYMSPTELKAKLDAAKEDPLYKWVYGDDESEIPPPPKPKAVPPKAREVVISITGTVRKK